MRVYNSPVEPCHAKPSEEKKKKEADFREHFWALCNVRNFTKPYWQLGLQLKN